MDLLSLLISVVGVSFSIYAVFISKNAKKAAESTIRKVNIQDDISEIRDILKKLTDAKSAANIWIPGVDEKSRMGRDCLSDLQIVRNAEDALAVWAPADMNKALKDRVEIERKNLHKYCEKICAPVNNENHWNGVVVSTQSLIRTLREHSRALKNSQLISTG